MKQSATTNGVKKDRILELLAAGNSVKDVARVVKVKPAYVYYVRWVNETKGKKGKTAKKSGNKPVTVKQMRVDVAKLAEGKAKKPSKVLAAAKDMESVFQQLRDAATMNTVPGGLKKPEADMVNSPAHYTTGGIETIDFIEAKKLGYNLGNVIKYITRADHKGSKLQDLEKAEWYLNREINRLKG